MDGYNELIETLQKIRRSEERLKVLLDNKVLLEQKVREKKEIMEKESYDVDKLEGLSISGFLHLIKGTLIDKLDQEEREALIAKNQYEFALEELNVCMKEIELVRDRIQNKFTVERQYETFLKNQEQILLRQHTALGEKIKDLTEKEYYLSEVICEIEEAEEAGQYLEKLFLNIIHCLDAGEDLGVVDILESGLLVSSCINETVKETNSNLVLIQQAIQKYHLEVMDVMALYTLNLDTNKLLQFSDRFLIGVLQGKELSDKLKIASEMIKEMEVILTKNMETLKTKKMEVKLERQQIKDSKVQMIETALEIK
ncbi:MAG: hypothetical protein JXR88_07025 [Clostridia bacterium]|nr:hypothetical protein [Clostridia bacterium]